MLGTLLSHLGKLKDIIVKLPIPFPLPFPGGSKHELKDRLHRAEGGLDQVRAFLEHQGHALEQHGQVLEQHGQVLEQQGEALRQMGGLLQELGEALQAHDARMRTLAQRQLWLAGGLGLALVALGLLAWRVLAA